MKALKVYISGKISGLESEVAKSKFLASESLLRSIGMTPVNPLEGADLSNTWEQHMVRDIELLMGCNAILLLDNWNESRGARIEKLIAEERGMLIMYESIILSANSKIKMIKDAVEEATGLNFEQYTLKSRKRACYFARMIFVHHCIECGELTIEDLAKLVNRNVTSILRYLNNYRFEVKYNSHFRNLAKKIEINLTNNVSQ